MEQEDATPRKNTPVGDSHEYSKAPFEDNVKKSIPPTVAGAKEGDTNHGHGGAKQGASMSEAKKYFEKDRDMKGRSSKW